MNVKYKCETIGPPAQRGCEKGKYLSNSFQDQLNHESTSGTQSISIKPISILVSSA